MRRRLLYQKAGKEITYTYGTPVIKTLEYGTAESAGETFEKPFLPYYEVEQTVTPSEGDEFTITILSTDDDQQGLVTSFSVVPDGREDVEIDGNTGALKIGKAAAGEGLYGVGTVTMTATLNGKTGTGSCTVSQSMSEISVVGASILITSFYYDVVPVDGLPTAEVRNVLPHLAFTLTEEYNDGRDPVETRYSTDNGDNLSAFNIVYRSNDFSNFNTSTGEINSVPATSETGDENIIIGEVSVNVSWSSYASASATTNVYQGVGEVPIQPRYGDIEIELVYNDGNNLPGIAADYDPKLRFTQNVYDANGNITETITGTEVDTPDGAEITYSVDRYGNSEEDVKIDENTGTLMVTNTFDARDIGEVTVKIVMNGVTGYGYSGVIRQDAENEMEDGWAAPEVNLTYDSIPWEGGEVPAVLTVTQYRYENGQIVETNTSNYEVFYEGEDLIDDVEVDHDDGTIYFWNHENTASQSRTLGVSIATVTANGRQSSARCAIIQEGQTVTYNPENNQDASKYGVKIGSVVNATISYLDLYATRIEVDADGNEKVLENDVQIMRLGTDSTSTTVQGGSTYTGTYTSDIKCGTYKPAYMMAWLLDRNAWGTNECTAGNFQSICPYTGDITDPTDIPNTQYTSELTNLEISNNLPNALINILNLTWN